MVADDSQQAAGRLVSDDDSVIAGRVRRIRAETTEALNQLGAAKAVAMVMARCRRMYRVTAGTCSDASGGLPLLKIQHKIRISRA
ncbi:hypothetical protein ACFSUK_28435 [Sphingobium scionense]